MSQYRVKEGSAVLTLIGMKSEGEEITAKMLTEGDKAIDKLKKKGVVEEGKPFNKADKAEAEKKSKKDDKSENKDGKNVFGGGKKE